MKKIILSISVIAVSLVLGGLGCKGLSEQEQAAVRPVTINYWTVFNDVGELRRMIEQYKTVRPYVTVNLRQVRVEEFETLFVNALAEDVGPDVVSMHARWIREHQNKLAPMPATIDVADVVVEGQYRQQTTVTPRRIAMPTPAGVRNAYVQTVGKDTIIGEQIYGLPLALDSLAIYYNKDLLDKAGVPQPPTTWAQFLEAVQAATRFDANGDIIQSGVALGGANNIENAPDILMLLMLQNGIGVEDRGVVTFAQGLERPAANHPALEALRFYTDFVRPTKEAYAWTEQMGNALDEFVRGRSVFYFGYAYDYPRIRALAPQMNLDIIPVPQLNPSAPSNIANYWVESVTRKSTHQNEAWDFVRFITSEPNVRQYVDATERPSPLRVHTESQREDLVLAPFVSNILTAENWYRGGNVDAAETAIRNLVLEYLKPYGERENPLARDATLIRNAARIIQQTY
jgi:multiple sugar transport system substrate-binding protein